MKNVGNSMKASEIFAL